METIAFRSINMFLYADFFAKQSEIDLYLIWVFRLKVYVRSASIAGSIKQTDHYISSPIYLSDQIITSLLPSIAPIFSASGLTHEGTTDKTS